MPKRSAGSARAFVVPKDGCDAIKKFFFICVRDFPFKNFERLGFVRGKDFLNGLRFVSNDYGFLPISYQLIKAMQLQRSRFHMESDRLLFLIVEVKE